MKDKTVNTKEFEYDFGLSFLFQGESVAEKIYSGLKALKIFIYSHEQEKLTGPDIEEKLIKAYGYNSRFESPLYLASLLFY